MSAKKIRVVQYGLGPIGSAIARLVTERDSLVLIGGIDIDPQKIGRDVGEVIALGRPLGLAVTNDADKLFRSARADIVLHSTISSVEKVYPQLEKCFKAKLSVISTCEELAFPHVQHPQLGKKIDALAKKHGVTVLGTGVNPGFVMDTLVVALTAVCQTIDHIHVTRTINASLRRLPFQKKIGAGLSTTEFQEQVSMGKVRHVGLSDSLGAIAMSLGWKLDRIDEAIEPIIAQVPVRSGFIEVAPGQVAGVRQVARGVMDGEERLVLDFQAYLGADAEDAVIIDGTPGVKMHIKGGIDGDYATGAVVVNAIPRVLAAEPGLITMLDLPMVRAF